MKRLTSLLETWVGSWVADGYHNVIVPSKEEIIAYLQESEEGICPTSTHSSSISDHQDLPFEFPERGTVRSLGNVHSSSTRHHRSRDFRGACEQRLPG